MGVSTIVHINNFVRILKRGNLGIEQQTRDVRVIRKLLVEEQFAGLQACMLLEGSRKMGYR